MNLRTERDSNGVPGTLVTVDGPQKSRVACPMFPPPRYLINPCQKDGSDHFYHLVNRFGIRLPLYPDNSPEVFSSWITANDSGRVHRELDFPGTKKMPSLSDIFIKGRITNCNYSWHRRYPASFSPCKSSSSIARNLYMRDACPFIRGLTRNGPGSFSRSFIFSVPAQLPRGGRCHRTV